jgi:hypothetical protein
VSQGTLCLMTPHILGRSLRTREDASQGCGTPGQSKREGGTRSDWLGNESTIRYMRHHIRALGHLVSLSKTIMRGS